MMRLFFVLSSIVICSYALRVPIQRLTSPLGSGHYQLQPQGVRLPPSYASSDWSPSSATGVSTSMSAISSGDLRGNEGRNRRQALASIASNKANQVKTELLTFLVKLKNLLSGNGFTTVSSKESPFSKKALAGLGLNALLAYGFVSNVSYITCLILSWVSHGKLTGMSPLAPGQKKQFLAIYGGFWVTNNILRPLRFSLSLVLTPFFNKIIDLVQSKTGFKRPTSTGIVVFLVNFCGTISYLVLGLLAATTITGTPLLP